MATSPLTKSTAAVAVTCHIGWCLSVWLALLLVFPPATHAAAGKPNFIIVFVDDLGYNDLSSYGASHIETPNIDRLAAEGIRFTDFYAQNVCGPSRAALLTGSYPVRVAEPGNRKNQHTVLHPREVTIAEVLKQQGYATGCIGKWHVAGNGGGEHGPGTGPYRAELMPNAQGFDYFFGTPAHNGTTRELDRWQTELIRNEQVLEHNTSMDTITKRETEEALAFVRKHRDEPFFLYLAYNMVHVVLGATPEFRGSSRRGLYGDSVQEIDHGVGELLNTLDELGLDENTLVVFTSDNGPWVEGHLREHGGSAFPLRGFKMTTWEGGARVPGIMRWPGKIKAQQVSSEIVSTLDFYPTFAALAGAKIPVERQLDGIDVSPFLLGRRDTSGRDTFFHYAWTYLQAVRRGGWKLVLPRPANPPWTSWYGRMTDAVETPELYHLAADNSELNNVAAQYPAKVAELTRLYEQTRDELGDYNLVGSGARFFDADPPPPGSTRKYREEKRRPSDIYTRLSTGSKAVGFRYADAIPHETGVVRRDPSDVIRVGGTYYVWYTKVTRQNDNYPSGYNGSLWYATSPDGQRWKEQGLCLAPSTADAWDSHGVFTPNIFATDNKYFLYYTAVAKPFDNVFSETVSATAIGVAISDSPDGPWQRHSANPILNAALDTPEAFDSLRVDDASLIVREDKIWMYYKGRSRAHGPTGPTTTQMGVALAANPTGPFVKHAANPLHSGHEVLVWPQSYGVGSMATAAGPRQLYYAFDGLQFTARNTLADPPHAPGIFREDNFRNNLIAPVPTWGIAHARAGDDLHLVRFDFIYGQGSKPGGAVPVNRQR
jgi:arylsulfatase A